MLFSWKGLRKTMQGFPFVGGVPFRVGDQVSKGMHGCLLLCCVFMLCYKHDLWSLCYATIYATNMTSFKYLVCSM
jgi:hypothetical protein